MKYCILSLCFTFLSLCSKSFERGINEAPKDYHLYQNQHTAPEGLAYKPTGRDRHLAMYNDLQVGDGTTVQENPFRFDPNAENHSNTAGRLYSHPPHSRQHFRRYSDSSFSGYGDPSSTSDLKISPDMNDVNEIEYDTAVAPMSQPPRPMAYARHIGDDGSPASNPSTYQGSSSVSTFKISSSKQRLVDGDVTPRSSEDGSQLDLRKGSSVSFIDKHQINLYNPEVSLS